MHKCLNNNNKVRRDIFVNQGKGMDAKIAGSFQQNCHFDNPKHLANAFIYACHAWISPILAHNFVIVYIYSVMCTSVEEVNSLGYTVERGPVYVARH